MKYLYKTTHSSVLTPEILTTHFHCLHLFAYTICTIIHILLHTLLHATRLTFLHTQLLTYTYTKFINLTHEFKIITPHNTLQYTKHMFSISILPHNLYSLMSYLLVIKRDNYG